MFRFRDVSISFGVLATNAPCCPWSPEGNSLWPMPQRSAKAEERENALQKKCDGALRDCVMVPFRRRRCEQEDEGPL